MSTFMSWLFHRGRADASSAEASVTSRALWEEDAGQQPRMTPLTPAGGLFVGLTHPTGGPLLVDFAALVHHQGTLFAGLTALDEKAALVSFLGTGITDPRRYENAGEAFDHLSLMAPDQEGPLLQVFRQQLREESESNDFVYIHFAGDPLSFGFLICALTDGGLMAGWKLG
jgi:hypothetical protein